MDLAIRSLRAEDHDALFDLASRAWGPVFASVNDVLGEELARLLHGEDWREYHASELRDILASEGAQIWAADLDGRLIGFAAAIVIDPDRRIGEVRIVGVDPETQRHGIASALMQHAENWLSEQGVAVVMVGTGGDPGHAPARNLYESLGYRLFPSAQYFGVLGDRDK